MIENKYSSTQYVYTELPAVRQIPVGINKIEPLIDAAERLFGFLPNEDDERWQIASYYCQAKEKNEIKPMNFENAMRSIYLSEDISFRNAIMAYTHEPNVRQLARAVINLNHFDFLKEKFTNLNDGLNSNFKIEFSQTNRINQGTDERGITGCPEALYQLRLFDQDEYIARIGFNIHMESKTKIVSITNIQGIPGGSENYKNIVEQYGFKPFNLLIKKLKTSLSDENNLIYRGLKNPKNEDSASLYNTVFKTEKIKRYSFKKEPISNFL